MTDDTASSNVVGLRRVLRHMAKDKARGVVTSNPLSRERRNVRAIEEEAARLGATVWSSPDLTKDTPDVTFTRPDGSTARMSVITAPIGQPPAPTPGQIAAAVMKYERTPRDAFNVFLACADPEIVYDFSSETEMRGDSFVITVTATPRRVGPAPAEGG